MINAAAWPTSAIVVAVIVPIVCLIVGAIIGFVIAQKYLKKQLDENPPVTRDQIRAMYQQMGRTPSESQINQVMEAMKKSRK